MISINVQAGPISFNKHKHSASPDQLRSLLSSLSPSPSLSPSLSASLSLPASAEHQFKLLSNFTYKLQPAAKCLAIYGLLLIRLPFAALCTSFPLSPWPDLTILMAHVWLSSGGGTSLVA